MRLFSQSLCFLLLTSCGTNPFGETKFSSCDHSPGGETGKPTSCQVSLGSLADLKAWIDPSVFSNINTSSASLVESVIDQSGQNSRLVWLNTSAQAQLAKASTNGRDALQFPEAETSIYQLSNSTNLITGGQDFSFAFVVKPQSATSTFSISSGTQLSFSLESALILKLNFFDDSSEVIFSNSPLLLNRPNKVVLTYNQETRLVRLYLNQVLVHSTEFSGSTSNLSQFEVTSQSRNELNEILIYSKELSSDDLDNLMSYLNDKWGF